MFQKKNKIYCFITLDWFFISILKKHLAIKNKWIQFSQNIINIFFLFFSQKIIYNSKSIIII